MAINDTENPLHYMRDKENDGIDDIKLLRKLIIGTFEKIFMKKLAEEIEKDLQIQVHGTFIEGLEGAKYSETNLKSYLNIQPFRFFDIVFDVKRYIEENPWVKSVELLTTINGISMTKFCESFTECIEDVCIFGGGAYSPDLSGNNGFVFSKGHEMSENGVVLLMAGGDDFHMVTMHITGWKPLGREFTVTKARDSRLYELDGQPAYEVYYKYLHINNEENFFENSLEFPIF